LVPSDGHGSLLPGSGSAAACCREADDGNRPQAAALRICTPQSLTLDCRGWLSPPHEYFFGTQKKYLPPITGFLSHQIRYFLGDHHSPLPLFAIPIFSPVPSLWFTDMEVLNNRLLREPKCPFPERGNRTLNSQTEQVTALRHSTL